MDCGTIPTMPLSVTAESEPRTERFDYALRGLGSIGFGVLIALALTLAFGSALWVNLAQSVCISICCWFAIDSGRLLAARWVYRHAGPAEPGWQRRWPGWPWMLCIIALGGVGGYAIGTAAANWMTGQPGPSLLRGLERGSALEITSVLVLSLVPSLAITYWFYSREMIATHEAATQTAQRQAAEHQLKLLESQLEPHMLFNTLANLRVLIGMDPPRAQAMLDRLIAFLRATLDGSRTGKHPLRAEFLRVSDYLALMQVRMGERLQTQLELPDALADLQVPPLLLQPLVENCIKHGLEPALAGGRIDVSAERDADELVLKVRDTGAGLAAGSGDGTRFGLVQVRERLATLYGAAASLTLARAGDAEGGTLATIRLPIAQA
jgi:signal transduction histidine kinase